MKGEKAEKKEIIEKKSKGIKLKIFHNKLIPPKMIDWEFFKSSDFPLNEQFSAQQWTNLMTINEDVYENLVREFYWSVKEIDSEEFEVIIKGEKYTISLDTIFKAFDIPNHSARLAKKADLKKIKSFNEEEFKKKVFGNSEIKATENVSSTSLSLS